MDKDLFKNDLWRSIDQASTDLHYLDHLRDNKERIEPVYKGLLAIAAILSVFAGLLGFGLLTHIATIATALMATLPFFFPIIPKSSDFSRMSELRVSMSKKLISLEKLWYKREWSDDTLRKYHKIKAAYLDVEAELYGLFGKIDKRILAKTHEGVNRYLNKFFVEVE